MDQGELQQIESAVLTAGYNRALGYVATTLTTAGVVIHFPDDFAAKLAAITIGLIGMAAHELIARVQLNKVATAAPNLHEAGYVKGINAALQAADATQPTTSAPVPQNSIPQPPPPKPLTDKIDS